MATVCREIQERIETTRTEARNVCREVSRTVSETICSWAPWPISELCDLVTRVIVETICGIVYVVITVISWITRVVCEIVSVLVWVIDHVIGFLEWLGGRILSLPELLLCTIGVRVGRKRLRICPIVIADKQGVPVIPIATIQEQINTAIKIYSGCNVDVIASEITVVTGKSHLAEASSCDAGGYFSQDRTELEHLTCCPQILSKIRCLRFPSGLIWPRHVLKAIWVNEISGSAVGCYLLPESFVLIDKDGAMDTLAHELGHACDLLHRDDEPGNLMAPGTVRTGSALTSWQCCVIRTGRFVTYF